MGYLFLDSNSKLAFLIRWLLFIVVVAVTVLSLFFILNKDANPTVNQSDTLAAESDASAFVELLKPIYEKPVNITIEKLEIISKELVDVGVSQDGVMEAPKGWNDVGYFIYGAKAGEPGNLIIPAHYDNTWGGPAAFWALKNLDLGDKVEVSDKYGRTYTYIVVGSSYVDLNDPNRLHIINKSTTKPQLILITCGGVWDLKSKTYSKRLLVTAELIG